MRDTRTLDDRIAVLLSTDTVTLEGTHPCNVHLIVAPFTPGPSLDFTGLTEATFPGYAAITCGTGAATVYNDPSTGLRMIEMPAPAGGFVFVATGATSPTQTVYGFVLTDTTNLITYGGQLLTQPVVISNSGDGVNLGAVTFGLTRFAMQ